MARFIQVGPAFYSYTGAQEECLTISCDSVSAVFVQAYNDSEGNPVWIISAQLNDGSVVQFRADESQFYATYEEACNASQAFADRLEKCRS